MHRLLTLAAGSLMALAIATSAQGQIVRVGPFGGVEVRLPRLGVSVDVLPFGQGSRVRAPFTAVDTGAYRYGYPVWPNGVYEAPTGYVVPPHDPAAPVYPAPIYPPSDPSTEPAGPLQDESIGNADQALADPNAVAEFLREAASQLHHELTQRPDGGEAWLDYLAPHRIIAAVDHGSDPHSLRSLLPHYEGVANSQLPDVYSTPGFRQTHQLLSQWVNGIGPAAPPQDDQPQQQARPAEPASSPTGPGELTTEELPAPAASLEE